MGRGLSEKQQQILGLAYAVAKIHGEPLGRGEKTVVAAHYWKAGLPAVKNAKVCDVNQPLAVHCVWGIPVADEIGLIPARSGYDADGKRFYVSEYHASNTGVFRRTTPGANAACVAACKSLRRLCERNLLTIALSWHGHPEGYVLTEAGEKIGAQAGFEIADVDFIRQALAARYNAGGQISLQVFNGYHSQQCYGR